VIERALKLSTLDKVRPIERVASVLRYEVESPGSRPQQSLHGILADLGPAPSEEDIADALASVLEVVERSTSIVEIPVDRQIGHSMPQVSRAQVPDLPDRIIAATALRLGVPLITRDETNRDSSVPTIW